MVSLAIGAKRSVLRSAPGCWTPRHLHSCARHHFKCFQLRVAFVKAVSASKMHCLQILWLVSCYFVWHYLHALLSPVKIIIGTTFVGNTCSNQWDVNIFWLVVLIFSAPLHHIFNTHCLQGCHCHLFIAKHPLCFISHQRSGWTDLLPGKCKRVFIEARPLNISLTVSDGSWRNAGGKTVLVPVVYTYQMHIKLTYFRYFPLKYLLE